MSKHDYRVTLRQIEEYAGRAQEIVQAKPWMNWWVIGKRLLRWPLQSYCEPNG